MESAMLLSVLAILYFVPAIVAHSREHNNAAAITVTNLFLGWTFIGWVAALIWASTSNVYKYEPPSKP